MILVISKTLNLLPIYHNETALALFTWSI